MALSTTVVSTITASAERSRITPAPRPASIVLVSSHSTPSSPIRPRQRVSEDGSIGGRCWSEEDQKTVRGTVFPTNVSPQKCWKYGVSTQRATTASSDSL